MRAPSPEDVRQFDRWSRTYERSIGQVFFFDPAHRAALRMAAGRVNGTPPRAVLDVGCGTGRLLRKAARRWPGAALHGVDPAPGMVETARALTRGAEIRAGNGEALPFADHSVDVAFSTISFHHWADQDAGAREVRRVLRPGGWFCLADITLPLFSGRLIPHRRVHTRREMSALLERAGFEIAAQRAILAGFVLVTVAVAPAG